MRVLFLPMAVDAAEGRLAAGSGEVLVSDGDDTCHKK
jgi:hypothetical protein